ncbi:unnamed protein product [Diamesa hyperborea]
MGFECILCDAKVDQKNEDVFGTPCGHMFHKDCIIDYVMAKNECPRCNAYCHVTLLFQLYCNLNESEEEEERNNLRLQNELLVHRMSQLTKQIKAKDVKFDHLFKMVEKISETMRFFDNNNRELKLENDELEEAIFHMRSGQKNENEFRFAPELLYDPSSQLGYP